MAYQHGDTLPPYQQQAIYAAGRARWHAILVQPLREKAAAEWFRLWNCDAFYPVERGQRWVRNRMVPYPRLFLPGYLFVHFNGDPRWHLILGDERRLARGVLRMSDGVTPGELHPGTLVELEAMRDTAADIDRQIAMRRALRRGDKAKVTSGLLEGYQVEVQRIDRRGNAHFDLVLMGNLVKASAPTADLTKLEEGLK